MLADPYFKASPPKSTGREYFNLTWLDKHLQKLNIKFTPKGTSRDISQLTSQFTPRLTSQFTPQDILATLVQLTSTTISNAILTFAPQAAVYICGGGAYNQTLMTALQKNLGYEIHTTTALGIAPEWVETGLFAWLAKQCLEQQPINLTSVTGASKAVTLGGVYYGT
jgi:anhydro-N-acetylmuramic acid kinase